MPPAMRPQLQRQNGVVEEQRQPTPAPSTSNLADVLPPVPVPQVLGVRPAVNIQAPAPALANCEPLSAPTIYMDILPPTSAGASASTSQSVPTMPMVGALPSTSQSLPMVHPPTSAGPSASTSQSVPTMPMVGPSLSTSQSLPMSGANTHFSQFPSMSANDQGVVPLPPFPSLRPDLAALMHQEIVTTEPPQPSPAHGKGVKRGLEPEQTPSGKKTRNSRWVLLFIL